MYDTQLGRNVRSIFEELAAKPDAITEADEALLRRRIELAIDELKLLDWPIERIIVRIKELASEVGIRNARRTHPTSGEAIVARAVLWSVERYYADRADDRSARRQG